MKQHFGIQAWNQPAGRGHGWAPCRPNLKDETLRFAIFRRATNEIVGWRKTKKEALIFAGEKNA